MVAAGASAAEVGNDAIPMRRAGSVHVGPALVHAARISYAGELGWELSMPVDWAVSVWDRLLAAGAAPIGYRAIESLRMEKGYRYYGTDLTMQDTPFDAGMGTFVRLAKGLFTGRDALVEAHAAEPARRLRTLIIGAADYEPIYGGEAVRLDGDVVSRLRSVAYGPTINARSATRTCRRRRFEGSAFEIDVSIDASARSSAPMSRSTPPATGCAAELDHRPGRRHCQRVVEGASRGCSGRLGSVPGRRCVSIESRGPGTTGLSADFEGAVQDPAFPDGTSSA